MSSFKINEEGHKYNEYPYYRIWERVTLDGNYMLCTYHAWPCIHETIESALKLLSKSIDDGWYKMNQVGDRTLWVHLGGKTKPYFVVKIHNRYPTGNCGGYYTIAQATEWHKELR